MMKSELSFLMDLFLNEEVSSPIKKLVADRIRDVEGALTTIPAVINVPRETIPIQLQPSAGHIQQSPSMQRIMQQHPDVPVTTVAAPATQAAAAALQHRAAIINSGMKEKPEPGRTSPRKF